MKVISLAVQAELERRLPLATEPLGMQPTSKGRLGFRIERVQIVADLEGGGNGDGISLHLLVRLVTRTLEPVGFFNDRLRESPVEVRSVTKLCIPSDLIRSEIAALARVGPWMWLLDERICGLAVAGIFEDDLPNFFEDSLEALASEVVDEIVDTTRQLGIRFARHAQLRPRTARYIEEKA